MHTEIRKFSDSEKELIEYFIKSLESSDIQCLQAGRVLFSRVSFIAIHCTVNTVEIIKDDLDDDNNTYCSIMSLCSFLKELKEHGYIGIDTILNNSGTIESDCDDFWIYDNKRYSVNNGIVYRRIGDDVNVALRENTLVKLYHSRDIFKYLKDYVYNKIIYPHPSLVELHSNHFRSQEELRHKHIMIAQWVTIFLSTCALIVSIILPNCCTSKIESNDLKDINQTITQQKNH